MKNPFLQSSVIPSFPIGDIRRSTTKKSYRLSISSFHLNQLKSALGNSHRSKNKKEENDSIVLTSSSKNDISHSRTLIFKNKFTNNINNNENNNQKIVDINHFYKLRKDINKIFKNRYKGPYMEHLIKKGFYKNCSENDYPKYYNYYQIYHLIDKKKFKLSINYDEFLLFNDDQEYLMKYLGNNEQYIIMNYLLYYVYNNDKTVIAENPKKILTKEQIQTMFVQLVQNNYQFTGTMEILDNIGVYFRMSFSNSGKEVIFLEKLKPVIKSNINYLYIKDLPEDLFPNCIPNIYPNLNRKIKYLTIYLKGIKYKRLKKFDSYDEKKNKDLKFNSNNNSKIFGFRKNNNYNHLMKNVKDNSGNMDNSTDTNKLEENILDNITISSDKEENSKNLISIEQIKQIKNHHNSNKRFLVDNDIYDIELLIDKFDTIAKKDIRRKSKKKATIREKKSFIFNKEIKSFGSIHKIIDNNKNNKKINENSLIENKNNIIMNNKKLFKKINKRQIFQTSLKGPISIKNKNKNKYNNSIISKLIEKNTIKNILNKDLSSSKKCIKLNNIIYKRINSSRYLFNPPKNKNNQKYINNLFRKSKRTLTQSNLMTLSKSKNNDKSEIESKDNIFTAKSYEKKYNCLVKRMAFISNDKYKNDLSINSNSIKNFEKYNNYYFRDFLSTTLTPQKDLNSITSNIKSSLGNKKFKIKKFHTLKEFENIYEKIKSIGLLPKNKNFFHGDKFKAFSNFSGTNFSLNKKYNEWAENKEDESSRMKQGYYILRLKKKINEENKKFTKLSKKFCTLKEVIKSPNIYY